MHGVPALGHVGHALGAWGANVATVGPLLHVLLPLLCDALAGVVTGALTLACVTLATRVVALLATDDAGWLAQFDLRLFHASHQQGAFDSLGTSLSQRLITLGAATLIGKTAQRHLLLWRSQQPCRCADRRFQPASGRARQ